MTTAAEFVITGARVHAMDRGPAGASALAVAQGRIIAVGDDTAIGRLCGPRTVRLDGRGRTVVPGLVDAHCHPLWGARALRDADLTDAVGLLDALGRLRAAAARAGGDGWIVGHGLRREWFDGPPLGTVLDAAVGLRPVFVSFADGHGALANPAGLARAGVTGPRRFADASRIVCDAAGRPTGELCEPGAMDAVRAAIPPLSPERRRALYRARLSRMAELGLTGAHVMDDAPGDLEDLAALEGDAALPVRLVVHLWLQPGMDDARIADVIARASAAGRRWRTGAVKFFLDGVVDQGTAWLGRPDAHGQLTGPNWPDPGRYAQVVARCVDAGLGCATHAIGDLAIRTALDAYAAARPAARGGPPCRIEHAELCDPADLGRFAAGGVIASLQPIHIAAAAQAPAEWGARLDPARRGWAWPLADLARAGTVLAMGSDWPVADQDPRLGMMWARQRVVPDGSGGAHREDQTLDAAAALGGYTTGAAAAAGEHAGGRIVPGAVADLTVLGADPFELPPRELPQMPVIATVVGGTIAYARPDA